EHYHEILHVLSDLIVFIFEDVHTHCKKEIEAIRAQFPAEPLMWKKDVPVLTFAEAAAMLQEKGIDQSPMEDFTTETERALGRIVHETMGTDFYIVDKFPMAIRPFYTMPDCENPLVSNSYDLFIRGEEITSGAQRIHDPAFLREQCEAKGIPVETIADYARSFEYGAPPHGGAGIGLERVVMLMLGLDNCRRTSMFPRTPQRLYP
ncbi:aspartyl-tRNA synthetase, archaeal-type, partial [Kipferlia bialata]